MTEMDHKRREHAIIASRNLLDYMRDRHLYMPDALLSAVRDRVDRMTPLRERNHITRDLVIYGESLDRCMHYQDLPYRSLCDYFGKTKATVGYRQLRSTHGILVPLMYSFLAGEIDRWSS